MIHSSSIISKKAKIGINVKIGPFCNIGDFVQLDDNVELISNVHIEGKTTIGYGTKIFPFASIGTVPQDLKYSHDIFRNMRKIDTLSIVSKYRKYLFMRFQFP